MLFILLIIIMILMYAMCSGGGAAGLASATSAELERLDWRLAIGEVSMNLRREVADKASREEMYSAIRTELGILEQQVAVSSSGSVGGNFYAYTPSL